MKNPDEEKIAAGDADKPLDPRPTIEQLLGIPKGFLSMGAAPSIPTSKEEIMNVVFAQAASRTYRGASLALSAVRGLTQSMKDDVEFDSWLDVNPDVEQQRDQQLDDSEKL